ncbi:hypothetical protein HJC23_000805 [Cyclotella cryptica]|uniref:Uncharacterized protein n=1 Tax=Cyclotella cryptica TaxID=29204 RepID=A0ABD3Q515_9STRA|eukprot:CCRYP_008435-RA/>CCRYP_008435-RA protein AED:0.46 eAED:0.46 QI:0/-1/0/1/-1/1/1/0/170
MCSSLQSKSPTISLHDASRVNNLTRQATKRVRFSEYSCLYMYQSNPSYRRKMSYSKTEIEAFRFRTASEAGKLRQLLAGCPIREANRICHILIHHNVVAPEELLGIEHLISEHVTRLMLSDRLGQRALLLKTQQELREKNELNFELLAEVATSMSAKNAERARVRATMAL